MFSNISYSILSTLFRMILNLGVIAIFARSLPFTVFSYYALGLLIAQVVCIFLDSGVNTEIMRFGRIEADAESNTRLAVSTSVRLCLGFALAILLFFCVYIFDSILCSLVFFATFSSGVIASIIETYFVHLKAKALFRQELVLVVSQTMLILVFSSMSFVSIWLTPLLILLPRVAVLYYLAVQRCRFCEYIDGFGFVFIKDHYFRLKYYSIDSIFSNVGMQMDSIVIAIVLGKNAYALYQPISRLYNAALGLGSAIGVYLIPQASACSRDRDKWKLLQFSFMTFGLVAAGGFYLFSGPVVSRFFGSRYTQPQSVVTLLAIVMMVRFAAGGTGAFLTLLGKQKMRAMMNVAVTTMGGLLALGFGKSVESIIGIMTIFQVFLLISYWVESGRHLGKGGINEKIN